MTKHKIVAFMISGLITLLPTGTWQTNTYGQGRGIRSIDFKNFIYRPSCLGDDQNDKSATIKTKDGVYSRGEATNPDSDRVYFEVNDVIYGDLDGDGQDEAIVTTSCNTGGTGQFTDGILFGMRSGKVAVLDTLGAGDRADGGIHAVRIVNGLIKVERYGQEHSGACCPEFIETTTLRFTAKGLVEVGKSTRKPYKEEDSSTESGQAAKPIHFERGHSSTQIKGSTKDVDNYTIRAKAEQTMIVSVAADKKNAALSVVGEDEQPIEGESTRTSWTGKLPYSGQYRIIVRATGGTAVYTLEVAIR